MDYQGQNYSNTRLASNMNTYSTRESVLKLGIDITKALMSYRKNGIYHAILTPADISVTDMGEFRLDYLPARLPEEAPFSSLTQLYAAPEVRVEQNSEQAVIYSLGTIMYKLMNGGLEPFRSAGDFESAANSYEIRRTGLKPSAPINADAGLSSIILKACEYKTSQRYSTLYDMHSDLLLLAEGKYGRSVSDKSLENEKKEHDEPVKKLPLIVTGIACALLCLGIIMICVNSRCNDIYIRAERRMRDGRFDESRSMFEDISWYKDSRDMILKCDYREADELLENGDADGAIKLLENLVKQGFGDARDKYNDALVAKSEILKSEGKTDEAMKILSSLAAIDIGDAEEILSGHKRDTAMDLMKSGKYDEASKIFKELGDDDMVSECTYRSAKDYKRDGRYAEALSAFYSIEDYNDSADQKKSCEELLIEKNTKYDMLSSAKLMEGRFENDDGYYVEYSVDKNGTVRAKYNLPFDGGRYFRLEDGVHYHSRDGEKWIKQWIYEAASPTEMTVYNYKNGRVYMLTKK